MGHTLRLFFIFDLKKDTNDDLCKKMPKVRIEQDKMLND
jgi:hypothetical protein